MHNAGIGPTSMKWSPCKVYGTKRRAAKDEGDLDSDPTRISTSLEIVPFVGEVPDFLTPSPNMLVLATSERFLSAGGTFRTILASESH